MGQEVSGLEVVNLTELIFTLSFEGEYTLNNDHNVAKFRSFQAF